MSAPIFNRDEYKHPVDGWYQIEAKGDHPNRAAGVVQVIDAPAINSIVNSFNADAKAGTLRNGKEMLVDREHWKDDPSKETTAYGWLQELQARSDGIYGRIRWTATGQAAVDGGDYRFFSTEYLPSDCKIVNDGAPPQLRPLKLDGLTLTNMNNNRGQKAITNRIGQDAALPWTITRAVSAIEMWKRTVEFEMESRAKPTQQQAEKTCQEQYPEMFAAYRAASAAMANRESDTDVQAKAAWLFNQLVQVEQGLTKIPTSMAWQKIANREPALHALAKGSQPPSRVFAVFPSIAGRLKLYNRALENVTDATANAAKGVAPKALDYLQHHLETVTDDIGARVADSDASAPTIWCTFMAQVKRAMRVTGLTCEQVFNKFKDDQNLFWTQAMLSFEPDTET